LYGCGDFINDYEGVHSSMPFLKRIGIKLYHLRKPVRSELGIMYLPTLNQFTGELLGMQMVPIRIKNIRINPAANRDVTWMRKALNREEKRWGTRVRLGRDGELTLTWDKS